ncbi:MAG: hypothetical protein ACJARX_002523 [Psychroserpens sp.]|jgi:hypothetical protein|uniref:hypothetical protein n=1 Tax=Psychroserpens sp. TaxID=2020870 RepID=UPI0039E685C3
MNKTAQLKGLQTYLAGYEHVLRDNNSPQYDEEVEPFFDWIANKLDFYESTLG